MEIAAKNGWYLSPKEVPLDIDSFTAEAEKRFTIQDSYWETIYLVGWIYYINLIKNQPIYAKVCNTFVPVLSKIDKMIAKENDWLRTVMVAPQHAFRIWKCFV